MYLIVIIISAILLAYGIGTTGKKGLIAVILSLIILGLGAFILSKC